MSEEITSLGYEASSEESSSSEETLSEEVPIRKMRKYCDEIIGNAVRSLISVAAQGQTLGNFKNSVENADRDI